MPSTRGLQFGVGQRLHLRFEDVDLADDAAELLDETIVAAAEDAGEQAIEHVGTGKREWEAGRVRSPQ